MSGFPLQFGLYCAIVTVPLCRMQVANCFVCAYFVASIQNYFLFLPNCDVFFFFFCSQTSTALAQYVLGSDASFFTIESLSKWLFSHSSPSYSNKISDLVALNNMSATATLSSEAVLVIGTVKNICETSSCDRRLLTLAAKFGTSVRQLLEHNHRCAIMNCSHFSKLLGCLYHAIIFS